MKVIKKFLAVNEFSRPGRKIAECKAVILHYVGIAGQGALSVWNYFENDCPRKKHYSSTQYIVDLNGDIYQTMPDNEVAYHCGSSKIDPASKRIYTDWARKKLGRFVADPNINSPNNCTMVLNCVLTGKGTLRMKH